MITFTPSTMLLFVFGNTTPLMNALGENNSKIHRQVRIILTPKLSSRYAIEFLHWSNLLWYNLLWPKFPLENISADFNPNYLTRMLYSVGRLSPLVSIYPSDPTLIRSPSRRILFLSIFFAVSGSFGDFYYYITPTLSCSPNRCLLEPYWVTLQ